MGKVLAFSHPPKIANEKDFRDRGSGFVVVQQLLCLESYVVESC